MSNRQNNLFAAEDWKVVYEAFSNVSLQAYDYQSIYNALVEYIRVNNPDEFNNYVTHTELMTHVNMLAYLGQSLAFRIDLNARENFFDTAERRDSILKLAYSLSYNTKRNRASHGVLKISSVTTTQPILDNTGNSLAGREISWNAPNDLSWYDNFIRILNNALSSVNRFGDPLKSENINGVFTDLYPLNTKTGSSAKLAYPFTANVNGKSYDFELVSSYITNTEIQESSPSPNTLFNILYRNDNNGVGSPNTGFFVQFKQGKLEHSDYSYTKPKKDRQEFIDTENINDTDVWVQHIRDDGSVVDEWEKVHALAGQSITYNSIVNKQRKVFAVKTEEDNKIRVVYSDGQFGDVPLGLFRVWHRVSENDSYIIRPNDIKNKSKTITYMGNDGQDYQLTIKFSLTYEIGNAEKEESVEDIATNAPLLHYTQDRMVNGEDYNIYPQTQSTIIKKIKTVNRTYAGHSRYIKAHDPTGSISSVNVLGNDGYIYKEDANSFSTHRIDYNTNYNSLVYSHIEPIIDNDYFRLFYYHNLRNVLLGNPIDGNGSEGEDYLTYPNERIKWVTLPDQQYGNVGYFYDTENHKVFMVGNNTNEKYSKFIRKNSIIKLGNGQGDVLWTTVRDVFADGFVDTNFATQGSIHLTDIVRNGWYVISVIPGLRKNINESESQKITQVLESNRSFGLRYDLLNDRWVIIDQDNMNNTNGFDLNAPSSPTTPDNRWLVKATVVNDSGVLRYEFQSRGTQFVFGSDSEVRFYFKNTSNVVDPNTGRVVHDYVKLLKSNTDRVNKNNRVVTGRAFVGQFKTENNHTPLTDYDITMLVGSSFGNIKLYDINDKPIQQFSVKEQNGKSFINLDAPRNTTIRVSNLLEMYDSDVSSKSLDRPYTFSLRSAYIKPNGDIDPSKVIIVPEDNNHDGIPDYPLAFDDIVNVNEYVFFKEVSTSEGLVFERVANDVEIINDNTNNIQEGIVYYCNGDIDILDIDNNLITYKEGYFYMGADNINSVRQNKADELLGEQSKYSVHKGRTFKSDDPLYFEWKHYAANNERIDPSITNLMSSYVLTNEYDNKVRSWVRNNGDMTDFPEPPTSDLIRNQLKSIEHNKMMSDQIVYIPSSYKLLFGSNAQPEYQASFKVIRASGTTITDNEIKSGIIFAINTFFEVDNWNFGEGFYFSDLSTFVHNQLRGKISSIVIVPRSNRARFGDLYELKPEPNELFLSTARVEDIEVVKSYTDYNLRKK